MREPLSGKNRANIVIITKCPKNTSPMEYRVLTKKMDLFPYQQLYFTSFQYAKLHPLFNGGQDYPLQKIKPDIHILLVTGIASPTSMIEELSTVSSHIHPLTFSDHHDFSAKDMEKIKEEFEKLPEGRRMIITTEKDSTRMATHPDLSESVKPYIYVLPIEVIFLQDQEKSFNSKIMDYVRKDSRNSHISTKQNTY
jgi:tetraacyldisaccharide 4'-kinase